MKFFRSIRKNLLEKNKIPKYLKYAIGEIILVVIGILIALQINNWNSDRLNAIRIEKYAKSLILDLTNDIEMIGVSQFQAKKCFNKIDSLKQYMLTTRTEDLSNTDLYILTKDIMYRPYKWNRSTFQELKNSEILQFFKNDSLKKLLIAYESFSYHLDEDFKADQTNATRAEEIVTEVLDLRDPYFAQMTILENDRFNDPTLNLFETEPYLHSKDKELKLTSVDSQLLKKFTNTFIQIQEAYRIRGFSEMRNIKEDAQAIIELLAQEY